MSLIFPSRNAWVTPRSRNIQIDTNNCLIMLPQKVDKIDRVLVKANNITVVARVGSSGGTSYALSDFYLQPAQGPKVEALDITKYIVELEKYDTLPLDKNNNGETVIKEQYKNNTHYYEHGGNDIHIIATSTKGYFFDKTNAFDMAIQPSFIELASNMQLYYNTGSKFEPVYAIEHAVYRLTNNPMSAQFRVYYTPLGESVKLQVPKTNPQPNQFCIPYSQQQPIVDNVTLGREMQSVANRAGCEKREVVRTFSDIKDYRDPNDHWYYEEQDASGKFTGNVWRLTGARLEIYRENMYRVVETWSKNWSYRSENVPINRQFRSWNIPADIVQRNLLWQDYCLLTRKPISGAALPDTSLLSDNAKQELMRGFDGSSSGKVTECNNMWYYVEQHIPNQDDPNKRVRNGAVMSCSTFGFGNSLVFSGKTKDNLSAGVQRVKSKSDDSNYEFCKDVYYCNEDGTLEEMWVQFAGEIKSDLSDAVYDYPRYGETVGLDNNVFINAPSDNSKGLFKDGTKFKVSKDPSEQLNFTYQLHLLTDDGYLLIGSTLAANNPLVKERDKAQTVKVWKLSKYLPQGAQVMTSAYGTEQQNSDLYSVSLDSDSPSITFNPEGTTNDGVGVCVTDENNAILIAFNGNKKATFDVKFTHDYDAIAQALKKQNN